MNVNIEYDKTKQLYVIDDGINIIYISPEEFKLIYEQFVNLENNHDRR
jgi:hypothetical protein